MEWYERQEEMQRNANKAAEMAAAWDRAAEAWERCRNACEMAPGGDESDAEYAFYEAQEAQAYAEGFSM